MHVERMKRFVDLTAPTNSEEGAESSVEGTVDFEIQKKVSWADEMDQRTRRKGAEEEEAGTEDQEWSSRGTTGEKGQSAARTDPDGQLVNQSGAAEQERSVERREEGGTDQAVRRYPLRVRKERFTLLKSVLLMACLAWPSGDGALIGGGRVGRAIYPALSLLTVMLLAPPLEGSKEIKLSSQGLLFQSIRERFFLIQNGSLRTISLFIKLIQ
jgi:hypothetical protein